MVSVPGGMGLSGGITTGTTPALDPAHGGCTACHGGGAFASVDADITITITDADGMALNGPYHAGDVYTISIALAEATGVGQANQAGFWLGTDAGSFESGGESVQIADNGVEATHTGAGFTQWTTLWTAPDAGAAVFQWYVNDVDGSGAPDAGDQVYSGGFWIPDEEGGAPGAVEEHEPHVGVELPQYWLGLIALASMAVVIIFGYVYLKYASPHNTDEKDR